MKIAQSPNTIAQLRMTDMELSPGYSAFTVPCGLDQHDANPCFLLCYQLVRKFSRGLPKWNIKTPHDSEQIWATTGLYQAFDPIVWVGKSAVNRSTNPLADPQACSVSHPTAYLAFASGRQRERRLCRARSLTADPCLRPYHLELVAQFPPEPFGPTGSLCSPALSAQAAGHLPKQPDSVFLHCSLFDLPQLCFRPRLSCDPSIVSISPWCVVPFCLIASAPLFFTASPTILPFHRRRSTLSALPVLDCDV